jgi:hypothetical protein
LQGSKNCNLSHLDLSKTEAPFQQWGLDFIGEINPNSSGQHKWILTTPNYFTKWVEEIPTREATDSVIIKFLEENILERFGCPRNIITDNSQEFKYSKLMQFFQNYNIELGHSTAYYLQGNGLVSHPIRTSLISSRRCCPKTRNLGIPT